MRSKVVYTDEGPKYYRGDEEITAEEFRKGGKIGEIFKAGKMFTASTGWPMYSDALGVNPKQIKEAHEESIRMGVPTDFDSKGRAILRDRGHRKKYCEANGLYDKSAGYGDAQPKQVTGTKRKKTSIFANKMKQGA